MTNTEALQLIREIAAAIDEVLAPVDAPLVIVTDDDISEDDRGRAAYLRALELEGCPAHWADPYVSVPAPDVDW